MYDLDACEIVWIGMCLCLGSCSWSWNFAVGIWLVGNLLAFWFVTMRQMFSWFLRLAVVVRVCISSINYRLNRLVNGLNLLFIIFPGWLIAFSANSWFVLFNSWYEFDYLGTSRSSSAMGQPIWGWSAIRPQHLRNNSANKSLDIWGWKQQVRNKSEPNQG